jgi:hypothetical protein
VREECLPERLGEGKQYPFLKKGQRNYYLEGEVALLITNGKELSDPIASIKILEATHFNRGYEIWTRGLYEIVKVFDNEDSEINFNWMKRVR